MGDSGSLDVIVDRVRLPATAAIGEPGDYLGRPGFWIGGAGVAAAWVGGARGVLADLVDTLHATEPSPHQLAHLGAVSAAVEGAEAALVQAAAAIDEAPGADHRPRAFRVRHLVEQVVTEVAGAQWSRDGRRSAVPGPGARPPGCGPACLRAPAARRARPRTHRPRRAADRGGCARVGLIQTEGTPETMWRAWPVLQHLLPWSLPDQRGRAVVVAPPPRRRDARRGRTDVDAGRGPAGTSRWCS